MPRDDRPRPLTGVRVLDLTRVLSGPHATRMLCDLGAEVIKVEPPDGDLTRFSNPRLNGLATYFIQQNVGKHNISLDMGKPEARQILLDLVAHCDVLVENFRPGVTTRMGLDYPTLSARLPALVYASISGYGQDGPWVHRRAYAPVVGAETGITRHQGDARARDGEEPVYAHDPHSHADLYTSLECASGILAALFQRERTGRGDHIDISMAQTMLYVNEHAHDHLWDGPDDPSWIRSFQPGDYPVLTAANGETVIVSGHPAERGTFQFFMAGIGRSDLIDDPRFVDVPSRLAHLDDIHRVLREWAATMASADAIEEQLAEHQLAVGQLRSLRDVVDTDWGRAREVTVDISDRGDGTVRIPNAPWRFANSDVRVEGLPRYRGEDNQRVLRDLLGYDEGRIAELDAAGVLSSRVPPSVR
jgi:crotonobetainyl-CoA:carnitine CoA-transferase CaiB-like acyl-CoA transferase